MPKYRRHEYKVLYKEVLFLLLNLCNDRKAISQNRLQDLVPLILDVFMKKRSKDPVFTIEMAIQDVLTCEQNSLSEPFYDEHDDDIRGQLEAQSDLDLIYIRTYQDLTIQEKYIFCSLLSEKKDLAILAGLRILESEFEKLKDSLIGKMQNAATSAAKQKKRSCEAYFPVGRFRRIRPIH